MAAAAAADAAVAAENAAVAAVAADAAMITTAADAATITTVADAVTITANNLCKHKKSAGNSGAYYILQHENYLVCVPRFIV